MVLTRDILSAWQTIGNGVVDENSRTRIKYWNHWITYTGRFNKDKFLEGCTTQQQNIIVTAFAARVRTGYYGLGNQVKAKSVADALSAVAKTFELAGKPSPIHQAHETYTTPVARLMEGFRREDPPPVPQLAVPLSVPEHMVTTGLASKCTKTQAIGDLATIAFYYLLRVGEYTKPRMTTRNGITKRATRTKQFKVNDVGFFKNDKKLPRSSKLHILLKADSCTLKITNQKNGRMGQTIHHERNHLTTCPVQACARRIHHILSNGGSTDNYI